MRIETIFGAVAVLALIVLAAFALSSGKGGVQAATPSGDTAFVLTAGSDACTCYSQAADAAARNPDFTRPAYEGGYGACRETAGRTGGDAWAAGWVAGMEGKSARCKRR